MIGFPQSCRKCILRLQRKNLRQISLFGIKKVTYWNFWRLNEKLPDIHQKNSRKIVKKNFYKSKRIFWGRWFHVNFKCLYLFLFFEQDGFRRPAKNFWTKVATANSFSRGTFWERILVQRTLDPFCGDWAKIFGPLMRTFRQGCCSGTLRVKRNTLRRNVIFEKFLLPRTFF